MYQTTLLRTDELWTELRSLGLLTPAQIEEFAAIHGEGVDPPQCVTELVEMGLLTPYQAEQVLAGKGRRLLVGPYLLRERLGDGGMGHVYKAEHRLMKRVVAVKIAGRLRRGHGVAAALRRFSREVEAAGRLNHPHIATAYDAGEAHGQLFLAMEYIEGIDLEHLVRQSGPLPTDLACEIVRQTAEALRHAHERNLIHRDIKPSNLMLAPPGVNVKLLDLGLALLTDTPLSVPQFEFEDSVEAELCGTPDFMAPECGQDTPIDVRGDLYSLGCTFYFLLTGQVPYPGGGWTEKLLRHHLDAPTPLCHLRPDVPAAIAAVVERLMARERTDRYPTATAVAAALGAIHLSAADIKADVVPVPLPPKSRRRGWSRFLMTTFIVVLFGVTVAGGARWLQGSAAQSPTVRGETSGIAFQIEGRPDGFASLAQAITAAQNGDTIVIQGRGPFSMSPMSCKGKTLTVRACGRERPRLVMKPAEDPWHALFHTDRALTLEGLDLAVATDASGGRTTNDAPLICCEGEPLHLTDCRLTSGASGAAIVVRDAVEVSVRGCRIDAGAVGLSLEVGQGTSCRIRLVDSQLTVRDESGVVLSLWSPEVRQMVPVKLELRGNIIRAGRVAAFRALPAGLTIAAAENRFAFRISLLSYAGYADRDAWRTSTVWQGTDNSYDGPASWLWVEGEPISLEQHASRTP
jgi:tRNA A-37 threonylcarbamoyl transferase component Bud32